MGHSIRTHRGTLGAALLFAALGIAACQPAGNSGTEGETTKEQDASTAVTSQDVIQMEQSLWETLGQGDYAAFGEKIAEDFAYPSGSGVIGKPELMSQLEGATVEDFELRDFRVKQPGSDVALVTYHYTEIFRPADADSAVTFTGWATSAWEVRDGNWLVVLHHSSASPDSME